MHPLILILKSLILLLLNPLLLLLECLILLVHLAHSFLLLPYERLLTLMLLSDSFLLHPLVHVGTCQVRKHEEHQAEQPNIDDLRNALVPVIVYPFESSRTPLLFKQLFNLYHKMIENAGTNVQA